MIDPAHTPQKNEVDVTGETTSGTGLNTARNQVLEDLISNLATEEGRKHATIRLVLNKHSSDPVMIERATRALESLEWYCDAARLSKEAGDPVRAVELLHKGLGKGRLIDLARDIIHRQIADIELGRGNGLEALSHLESGRFFKDAASLATKLGLPEKAAELSGKVDDEPARGWASAMARNLRAKNITSPDPQLEDLIADSKVSTGFQKYFAFLEKTARKEGIPTQRGKNFEDQCRTIVIAAAEAASLVASGNESDALARYAAVGLEPASAFLELEKGNLRIALEQFARASSGTFGFAAWQAQNANETDTASDLWKKARRHDIAAAMAQHSGDKVKAIAILEEGAGQTFLRPDFNDPVDLGASLWYPRSAEKTLPFRSSPWKSNIEKAVELAESMGDQPLARKLLEKACQIAASQAGFGAEHLTITPSGAASAAEKLGRIEDALQFLESGGDFKAAARIALRNGQNDRAAMAYERAGQFDKAYEVCVDPIRKQTYATLKHLLSA